MNQEDAKEFDDQIRAAAWTVIRGWHRPVHALLRYVTSQRNPAAALRSMMDALPPGEAAALLPEIELEKNRRHVWLFKSREGENP